MTFPVFQAGKEGDPARARAEYETLSLIFGAARRTIFLNGGSQTRREAAEDIIAAWNRFGVPARRIGGHAVEIGNLGK